MARPRSTRGGELLLYLNTNMRAVVMVTSPHLARLPSSPQSYAWKRCCRMFCAGHDVLLSGAAPGTCAVCTMVRPEVPAGKCCSCVDSWDRFCCARSNLRMRGSECAADLGPGA